jgi:hypothetical protein
MEAPDSNAFGVRALPLAFCAIANLRMALEYCAQEVQRTACPTGDPVRSAFPIATTLADFKSDVGRSFPGLLGNRLDLWNVLLNYQSFSVGGFDWLPLLHGLWNHSKHVDLAPEGVVTGGIEGTITHPSGVVEKRHSFYLLMQGTRPLGGFLTASADGIERVINELGPLVQAPLGRQD